MQRIIYKIILLGNSGVGKTSCLVRYVDDKFNDNYKATLGFDISIKSIRTKEVDYSLAIWDIAGQDAMAELRKSYMEGSQGAILIYDVTNEETFNSINYWLNQLYQFVGHIPIILVGNKIDLTDKIKISTEKGQNMAKLKKLDGYYETSAKTGQKVNEIFRKISELVYNYYSKQ